MSYPLLITLVFFLLSLIGILNHEMWSDELMFWMIARDNATVGNLIQTLRFEYMHPWLWGILLFGLSRLTREPLAMQLLHILIATGAVFLLVQYSPFTRVQKTLLVFGYFLLFEYSLISRNYGLGVLLIFLCCVLFPTRKRRYLPLAILLAVLANINFYSRMTAIALITMLVLEYLLAIPSGKPTPNRKWDIAGSLLIVAVGLLLSGVQNIPPPAQAGSLSVLSQGVKLNQVVSAIANLWRAYFPMPGLTLRFWNSNIIDDGFAAALSWIPLGFSIALFYRRPLILFLYLFNLTEILLFHSLWTGLMRHLGHIFILFIACLWLSDEIPPSGSDRPSRYPVLRFFDRHCTQFVTVVLVVQVVAGAYAYTMDLFHPFSEAKPVAQYLRRQQLDRSLIAGGIDVFTQSVSGHLDQPIFYPERDRMGTYISSDNSSQRLPPQQYLERVARQPGVEKAVFVLNFPLQEPLPALPGWNLQELARFDRGIVKVENFYLYQFEKR